MTGQLVNNGDTTVNGIQAELDFKDRAGRTLTQELLPVIVPGSNPPQTQNLAEAPIKPSQARAFRIHASQVPAGWDQHVPEMKIVTVTGSKP